jgi:hypothetical protein
MLEGEAAACWGRRNNDCRDSINGIEVSTYARLRRLAGGQKSLHLAESMLPVPRFVLILETEKSSLERFDPRAMSRAAIGSLGTVVASTVSQRSLPTSAL